MSNHDLQDHIDIEATLRSYARGLDERRWAARDSVFTDDAIIDCTPMGGRRETPAELRSRLSEPDPTWLFASGSASSSW